VISDPIHALVAETLTSRAAIANALCTVAEEEFHDGQQMRAAETVRTTRGVLAYINLLLCSDTSYLPYGTLREISEILDGLDERIEAMEPAIRNYSIH
jgi:hypothetical protein